MNAYRLLALFGGAFAFAAVTSSCAAPKQPPPPPPAAQQLWGDMKPIVSVKELMRDMIDPASDYIFDAIGETDTKQGTVITEPKTDKDWEKIRIGAVSLAEGVYLLKIPRPFAPAGDENNSTGPDPEELSPAQIRAKLEADPVLWNAKIEALRNVGLQVLEIVKRKDAKELWDAAENLDDACETCHLAFWYPGEKAYLKKLDKHLQDLSGQRGASARTQRGRPGTPTGPT